MTCDDTTESGLPLPKYPHPKWHQEVNNSLALLDAELAQVSQQLRPIEHVEHKPVMQLENVTWYDGLAWYDGTLFVSGYDYAAGTDTLVACRPNADFTAWTELGRYHGIYADCGAMEINEDGTRLYGIGDNVGIFDISDPSNITLLDGQSWSDNPSIAYADGRIYAGDWEYMYIYDVSADSFDYIDSVGRPWWTGKIGALYAESPFLYVTEGEYGRSWVTVYDIYAQPIPTIVGLYPVTSYKLNELAQGSLFVENHMLVPFFTDNTWGVSVVEIRYGQNWATTTIPNTFIYGQSVDFTDDFYFSAWDNQFEEILILGTSATNWPYYTQSVEHDGLVYLFDRDSVYEIDVDNETFTKQSDPNSYNGTLIGSLSYGSSIYLISNSSNNLYLYEYDPVTNTTVSTYTDTVADYNMSATQYSATEFLMWSSAHVLYTFDVINQTLTVVSNTPAYTDQEKACIFYNPTTQTAYIAGDDDSGGHNKLQKYEFGTDSWTTLTFGDTISWYTDDWSFTECDTMALYAQRDYRTIDAIPWSVETDDYYDFMQGDDAIILRAGNTIYALGIDDDNSPYEARLYRANELTANNYVF